MDVYAIVYAPAPHIHSLTIHPTTRMALLTGAVRSGGGGADGAGRLCCGAFIIRDTHNHPDYSHTLLKHTHPLIHPPIGEHIHTHTRAHTRRLIYTQQAHPHYPTNPGHHRRREGGLGDHGHHRPPPRPPHPRLRPPLPPPPPPPPPHHPRHAPRTGAVCLVKYKVIMCVHFPFHSSIYHHHHASIQYMSQSFHQLEKTNKTHIHTR